MRRVRGVVHGPAEGLSAPLRRWTTGGHPDPLQMSAMMNAYPGEFFLGDMPMPLQRLLFGPLGYVLRRFFGFRPLLRFADLQAPELPNERRVPARKDS
jgi:hypothetical protein